MDEAPAPDTSNHESSAARSRIIGGDQIKKKRKIINLDFMYLGGSGTEETPKRKTHAYITENSQTQEAESVSPIPKRKKMEDTCVVDQIDQEHAESSSKKKKDESRQEKKIKSHKAKDSKKLHDGERLTEEAPCTDVTDPEGTSKKKPKKDGGERLIEDRLAEELLNPDTQHTSGKKKKQRDGGGLQGGDEKYPEGSKAREQVEQSVRRAEKRVKKKKKKRKDEPHREAKDVAVEDVPSIVRHPEDNKKIKRSRKAKKLKGLGEDEELTEEALSSKPANVDDGARPKKNKKSEKNGGQRLLEDRLVEESLTPDTQHTSGKKWKGGGGHWGDNGEKYPEGSKTPEQVDECVSRAEKPVKKKKRKDEPHREAEDLAVDHASSIVHHREDNKEIEKSHKAKKLKGLGEDEELTEEALSSKPANVDDGPRLKKKKKPKKNDGERLQEDRLNPDTQHTSGEKKKRKGGGGHREDDDEKCPEGSKSPEQVNECVSQAKKRVKKTKKPKKNGGERLLEDRLVEESLTPDTQHTSGKKKKRKGGGGHQGDNDEKHPGGSKTLEQVDECVSRAEKRVKKKKRKDEPHREAEDLAVDHTSSIVHHLEDNKEIKRSRKDQKGLGGDEGLTEEALSNEPANVDDGPRLKKKKKPKKNGGERLREDGLNPDTQHRSGEKKKRKGGGGHREDDDEIHLQHCITEELSSQRKYPDGSGTSEQVEESVDQAEKPVKKKKKRKDESHQEADDAPTSVVLYKEENIRKSPKTKDRMRHHGDEPPYSELTDTEDRPSRKKKKKPKKDHGERLLEGLMEESAPDAQHTSKRKRKKRKAGREESDWKQVSVEKLFTQREHQGGTEQVGGSGEQTGEPVKKRKKKRNSQRGEETPEIATQETQLEDVEGLAEGSLSSHCRAVESDGDMEGDEEEQTDHTSTGIRSRTETMASADQNPATQEEHDDIQDGDNRLNTSAKKTRKTKPSVLTLLPDNDLALLEEYFPKIKTLGYDSFCQYVTHELERVREAKKQGIMFRHGRFTVDEDEKIRQNVQTFMSQVGIDSAELLFHPYKFPNMKKSIEQMKRTFNFRHRIGEGLYRTATEVTMRGSKLYERSGISGRYTKEEVQQLKAYHELHGNKWLTIGTLMDRTGFSAQLKVSQLRRELNFGPWSVEETNRLITAVKEFVLGTILKEMNNNTTEEELVTIRKEKLYKGIPWVKMESLVTYHFFFYTLLFFTISYNTLSCLIRRLYDSNMRDIGDVKWNELSNMLGNVPTTCTQIHFHKMKKTVPGWKTMRLYEIVDYLYCNTLKKLEAKLSVVKEYPIEPETKDEFLIREMFCECAESVRMLELM
ncbi:transcription termination factor 1 [Rhinoderma darwinii]|uniref:transcription termination factor 1 n=1 Tax=Rhinoderma darwinii TaxID=43563 RepID=UPI003F6786EE